VAADGGEGDQQPQEIIGGAIARGAAAEVGEQRAGGDGGQKAFEQIEDEDDGEEPAAEQTADAWLRRCFRCRLCADRCRGFERRSDRMEWSRSGRRSA